MTACTQRFVLAGQPVVIEHRTGALEGIVARLYEHGAAPASPAADDDALRLVVEAGQGRAPELPAEEILSLSADRPIRGALGRDVLALTDGRTYATADYARGSAGLTIYEDDEAALFVAARRLFPIVLGELLRCRGCYPVHGAAIDGPGGGILLLGDSGAGKSTLVYRALSQGFRCVADDGVILAPGGPGGARIYPFYRDFTLDPALLPTGLDLPAVPSEPAPTYPKVRVELPSSLLIESCVPRKLALVRRADAPASRVEPCTEAEAVAELYRQHPWLAVYPPLAQPHLDELATLATACAKITVHSGVDILQSGHKFVMEQ